MGNFQNKILDIITNSKTPQKILVLGLDSVGKTTILYKLKLDVDIVQSVPTIGFSVEEFEYKNLKFMCWDIDGSEKIRSVWLKYYENTTCLIYVIDSSDIDRIEQAKKALHTALRRDGMQNVPVLVFANKIDIAEMSIPEITQKMELQQLTREWNIQGTCAFNGQGIREGFEWISKTLKNKK